MKENTQERELIELTVKNISTTRNVYTQKPKENKGALYSLKRTRPSSPPKKIPTQNIVK